MKDATFDAAAYKAATTEQWQSAAKAWSDWGGLLRHWLGPATDMMIDLAGISSGSSVLDVAAGAGDQSMQIADRVGPNGYVLATDISSNILDYASAHARAAGLGQIEFKLMDGEKLSVAPESFDAAVSRVGMIYFPDPMSALAGIKDALKPGGRFSAVVYSTPERNGFFSIPVATIRAAAKLPPPAIGQPGPFSLGQPGVLANVLRKAGFNDIRERTVAAPLSLPSAAECTRFERDSFGALHQMLSSLSTSAQDIVWAEIEMKLKAFETETGFAGPCELVIVSGRK